MNSKVKETKMTRRPYRKPQFEKVRLVPEEAVLTNCKTNATTVGPGSFQIYCSNPGGQNRCSVLGS